MLWGINPKFPWAIPQLKEGCVRVTHPFATRHPVLLPVLPFDLHVLGLPLAFILSQDQTLHCKCCLILTIKILSKFDVILSISFANITLP